MFLELFVDIFTLLLLQVVCNELLFIFTEASYGSELNLDALGSEEDSGLEEESQSIGDLKLKENLSNMSLDSQSFKDSAYEESVAIPSAEPQSQATTDSETGSIDKAEEETETEEDGLMLPSSYTDAGYVNIDEKDVDNASRLTSLSSVSDIPDNENELAVFEQMTRLMSMTSYDAEAAIERYFNIDAIACDGVPILHCVRLMCSFLLAGKPGTLLPDSRTRVSVKSLALNCLSQALSIYPEAFLAKVMPEESPSAVKASEYSGPKLSEQCVRDCLLFEDHGDPQIRGMISHVAGSYIKAALCQSG